MMRPAKNGFTLVEVLVALVVSALLLPIVIEGSTNALRRLRVTEDRREALLTGRYLLLRGSVLDYGGGNGQGRSGRLAWASQETVAIADPRHMNALMRIRVVVRDASGGILFDRSTLRLKRLPQL